MVGKGTGIVLLGFLGGVAVGAPLLGLSVDLWQTYAEIPEHFPERFAMRRVSEPSDIYPVFRDLFERKPE